eukprot:4636141-Pleurochrysis_carterae.AAC.2
MDCLESVPHAMRGALDVRLVAAFESSSSHGAPSKLWRTMSGRYCTRCRWVTAGAGGPDTR